MPCLQAFYEGARDMGWSDTKKRAQLTAPEARLLVVTGKVPQELTLPQLHGHPHTAAAYGTKFSKRPGC